MKPGCPAGGGCAGNRPRGCDAGAAACAAGAGACGATCAAAADTGATLLGAGGWVVCAKVIAAGESDAARSHVIASAPCRRGCAVLVIMTLPMLSLSPASPRQLWRPI